jgi:hypothetical protein
LITASNVYAYDIIFSVSFSPSWLYTATFLSSANGKPTIINIFPQKWFKSAGEGVKFPEGWECTVPTMESKLGYKWELSFNNFLIRLNGFFIVLKMFRLKGFGVGFWRDLLRRVEGVSGCCGGVGDLCLVGSYAGVMPRP